MRLELSKRIFLNFVIVIAAFCILGALLGAHLINRNVLNEAQRRVRLNLRSGWSVIHSEIDQIGLFVSALFPGSRVAKAYGAPESQTSRASLEAARQKCGFVREEKKTSDSKFGPMVRRYHPITSPGCSENLSASTKRPTPPAAQAWDCSLPRRSSPNTTEKYGWNPKKAGGSTFYLLYPKKVLKILLI